MTESVADRHRRLAATFHAIVESASAADLDTPSRCDGWTVGDVVDHVVTTQRDFLEQRQLPTGAAAGSPTQDLEVVNAAMQAALDDPAIADRTFDGFFGPTTIAEVVDAFYCLDLLVHSWDIAAALGTADQLSISDDDIARARAGLEPMGDNVYMAGIFGPAVDPGPSPSPLDAFLAWTGRQPIR